MKVETTKDKIHFMPENDHDIFLIGYMCSKNPNTVQFVEATNESPEIKYISFEVKDVIKALQNNKL